MGWSEMPYPGPYPQPATTAVIANSAERNIYRRMESPMSLGVSCGLEKAEFIFIESALIAIPLKSKNRGEVLGKSAKFTLRRHRTFLRTANWRGVSICLAPRHIPATKSRHKIACDLEDLSTSIREIAMHRTLVGICLTICVALLPASAHAIGRYVSTSMTCAKVQATISQQGAVILQHKSARTGNLLYDRYVKDRRYCSGGETTDWASVPTKDQKSCPVYRCEEIEFYDFR